MRKENVIGACKIWIPCHNLNLGAETALPGGSKFENFILLLQLVVKLKSALNLR